ncbi:MFS transporter [Swingsia samuiensis]|uniref:MFS transporter n=1 Tax=Swingsia samuiensis TaxID=1293412 RepID=A0A4Y6UMB2_9PROT|nr:MFS transporter [Swingsia samuiensis]
MFPNEPFVESPHVLHSKDVLGHPKGFWVLVLTEAFVAFSLYGMQAILVIYLMDQLLLPGHIEHVWGINSLLGLVGFLYAPSGIQATAGAITGLFLAIAFATPLLGGIIADRFLGRTKTIIIGSVLMTIGHILMLFDWGLVFAILFILIGIGATGALKSQVGSLYALDDQRRSDAYQIYVLGIQIAVIISPALCAFLAQKAWDWGFLVAGIGMLIGLVIYLSGLSWLPKDEIVKKNTKTKQPSLSLREKKATFLLIFLIPVMAISALTNQELSDGYLLWGREHYQKTLFGHPFPISSLVSWDGLISSITGVVVFKFLHIYARYKPDSSEITKVTIGAFIIVLAPIVLAFASYLHPQPHGVSLYWGLLFHTINDIGTALTYALGMALYSRAAPKSLNTMLISCFSLQFCISSLLVGKLSTLIGQVNDVSFWLFHAGTALFAALILLACNIFFYNLLAPETSEVTEKA